MRTLWHPVHLEILKQNLIRDFKAGPQKGPKMAKIAKMPQNRENPQIAKIAKMPQNREIRKWPTIISTTIFFAGGFFLQNSQCLFASSGVILVSKKLQAPPCTTRMSQKRVRQLIFEDSGDVWALFCVFFQKNKNAIFSTGVIRKKRSKKGVPCVQNLRIFLARFSVSNPSPKGRFFKFPVSNTSPLSHGKSGFWLLPS